MITIGRRSQMLAMAGYSDNTVSDVTTLATWQSSDPAVVSILPTGYATSLASGTATIRATYHGVTGSLQLFISGDYYEDCYTYGADTVRIVQNGSFGWALVDGLGSFLVVLATEADAENALALAQRYQSQCWIGRGNGRPNQRAYIVDYWAIPTGHATTISPEDCVGYSPGNLQVVNLGTLGWAVMDGSAQVVLADNQPDALAALTLAQRYSSHCFIGRGNTRPDPDTYIVEYWK